MLFSLLATAVARWTPIPSTSAKTHAWDPRRCPRLVSWPPSTTSIVANYDRLGGLCPGAFLKKWGNKSTGYYTCPPNQGFQFSITRKPIDGNQTLEPGMLRALPPLSLNDPKEHSNYHVYQVERKFTVVTSTISVWFGQSGQGMQYYIPDKNIATLVAGGFLSRSGEENILEDLAGLRD
ncbi:hypothetical protein FB451DRAFT_1555335 [Mycena latifolia]|nr:hypothetical protein FB451DRAFT_1555335 [Mycena latifolia]